MKKKLTVGYWGSLIGKRVMHETAEFEAELIGVRKTKNRGSKITLTIKFDNGCITTFDPYVLRPVLRTFDDMTEEEKEEFLILGGVLGELCSLSRFGDRVQYSYICYDLDTHCLYANISQLDYLDEIGIDFRSENKELKVTKL